MKELFLCAALALPSAVPYHATPHWNFGDPDVKIVRMLRDWPNGKTASRPTGWVLLYGRHPLWMHQLRDAGIKTIGMYRQKLNWPGYIQGDPLAAPFRDNQFQVYIYDEFPHNVTRLAKEVTRIVAPWGFFLFRYTKNGDFAHALMALEWERFDWDFHEFMIWWHPHYYSSMKLSLESA